MALLKQREPEIGQHDFLVFVLQEGQQQGEEQKMQ